MFIFSFILNKHSFRLRKTFYNKTITGYFNFQVFCCFSGIIICIILKIIFFIFFIFYFEKSLKKNEKVRISIKRNDKIAAHIGISDGDLSHIKNGKIKTVAIM